MITVQLTSAPPLRRQRTLLHPISAVCIGASILFSLLVIPLSSAEAQPPNVGSIILNDQSSIVTPTSGFSLSATAVSSVPASNLVLRVGLYPRLLSRYALEHQPLAAGPTETLNDIALAPTIHFRVQTPSGTSTGPKAFRTLRLDCLSGICDGVYPVAISLINRANGQQLASLTTSLIYLSGDASAQRLSVALALPLDLPPDALHSSAPLSLPEATAINSVVHAVVSSPENIVSLNVYGRLLERLQADVNAKAPDAPQAHAAIVALRRIALHTERDELLMTPYAPIDLDALIVGVGSAAKEFNAQMALTRKLTSLLLRTTVSRTPYLSLAPVGIDAASLLAKNGVCAIALPLTDLSIGGNGGTASAPFHLANTSSPCSDAGQLGLAIDLGYSEASTTTTTAHLAAHQLLADLSQTYFEDPRGGQPRGVVVVPSKWANSNAFITTLLAGIRADPILAPVTLDTLTKNVPIGSDKGPESASLNPARASSRVDPKILRGAYSHLNSMRAITPADHTLLTELTGEIFSGEAVGLTGRQRLKYFDAPKAALATIAGNLRLSGSSHVTFTSSNGKIPVTIHYSGPSFPVHVDLKIKSSSIDFPPSEARQHLTLTTRDTNEVLKVSTRSSGGYSFTLELLAPKETTVLLGPSEFDITSTAASGVAIGLSAGALLVLALWWSRSIFKHRREKLAKSPAQTGKAGSIPQ